MISTIWASSAILDLTGSGFFLDSTASTYQISAKSHNLLVVDATNFPACFSGAVLSEPVSQLCAPNCINFGMAVQEAVRAHNVCFSFRYFHTRVPQRQLGGQKSRLNFTLSHPVKIRVGYAKCVSQGFKFSPSPNF